MHGEHAVRLGIAERCIMQSRAKLHSLGRMRQDGRVPLPLLFTYVQAYSTMPTDVRRRSGLAEHNVSREQYTRITSVPVSRDCPHKETLCVQSLLLLRPVLV